MASLALGVKFIPASSGTGDFVYSTTVGGYRGSSALVDGKTYRYRAENTTLTEWEYGTGVWSSSTGTLTRATVSFSSTGSKVSFASAPMVGIIQFVDDVLQFDDAMSLTGSQQAQGRSNLYAAPFDSLAFNGMQINGGCQVSQEIGTAARTTNDYIVDGWKISASGTMAFSAQQITDAPPGFSNSIKVSVTTAQASIGSSNFLCVYHQIEGYRVARLGFGSASAFPVSIGFWYKANRTGVRSAAVRNGDVNRSYPFTFTVSSSGTWEYKTVTIPGDVSGTWDKTNGIGLTLLVSEAVGSTYQGTVNTWNAGNYFGTAGTINGVAATSDYFQITGLTVLPGIELPTAEQSSLLLRPFDQELFSSKRYWESSYNYGVAPGTITTVGALSKITQTGSYYHTLSTRVFVSKRATPTVSLYSTDTGSVGKIAYVGVGDVAAVPANISQNSMTPYVNGVLVNTGEIVCHFVANSRL